MKLTRGFPWLRFPVFQSNEQSDGHHFARTSRFAKSPINPTVTLSTGVRRLRDDELPSGGSHGVVRRSRFRRWRLAGLVIPLSIALVTGCAPAGVDGAAVIPRLNVGIEAVQGPGEVATALQILVLLTILTLAPSILIMMTSFTRTIIVLSLIRNAMGIPQLPPNPPFYLKPQTLEDIVSFFVERTIMSLGINSRLPFNMQYNGGK